MTQMRMNSTTSITDHQSPAHKCVRCEDTGTINVIRRVKPEGYPIEVEVATNELCSCHFDRQLEKYNAAESFSAKDKEHTFTNAVIDEDNKPMFEIAVDFIKNIDNHLKWGTWLYIFGDEVRAVAASQNESKKYTAFGTGKTYMMQCIANALMKRRIPSIYINEEKLFGDIKATYERNSEENEQDVLRRYYSIPVLMIDDLFSISYKDWAEGKLFSILDARVNDNKITIITSNYATGRISQRLPINGGKISSRITGQAQMIEMIGKDRRVMNAKRRRDESA
jgi:DNA replication protein DnaC